MINFGQEEDVYILHDLSSDLQLKLQLECDEDALDILSRLFPISVVDSDPKEFFE